MVWSCLTLSREATVNPAPAPFSPLYQSYVFSGVWRCVVLVSLVLETLDFTLPTNAFLHRKNKISSPHVGCVKFIKSKRDVYVANYI